MKKFIITFGQQYRYEEHPAGGHPDGVFVVHAENEAEARDIAFRHMGPQWSMHDADNFEIDNFPLGVLQILY